MSGNPAFQNLDPASAPDPVTPADSPGDAAGFSMVTPHGQGTAPYDIQALGGLQQEITAGFDAANALAGAGVLYPMGPRQQAARELMESPPGFNSGGGLSGFDITQGWSGEPDESWANNTQAAGILETPVQGQMGTYPGGSTYQDGLEKYGTS